MESKAKRHIVEGAVDLVREGKPKGEKEYVSVSALSPETCLKLIFPKIHFHQIG